MTSETAVGGGRRVVQLVVVEWTKRSRGMPGAAARAAVPEVFRLPELPAPAATVVHDVSAAEAEGFRPVEAVTPHAEGRFFRLQADGDRLAVRLTSYAQAGYSAWGPPQVVFRLAAGTWGQLRWNRRYASRSDEWRYRKFVLNVGWWPAGSGLPATDVFVATDPVRVVDRQVALF